MLRIMFDLMVAVMDLVVIVSIVKYWKSKETRDDEDTMTHSEFIAYLETLAQLIEAKAETKDEAVKIIRELMERLN